MPGHGLWGFGNAMVVTRMKESEACTNDYSIRPHHQNPFFMYVPTGHVLPTSVIAVAGCKFGVFPDNKKHPSQPPGDRLCTRKTSGSICRWIRFTSQLLYGISRPTIPNPRISRNFPRGNSLSVTPPWPIVNCRKEPVQGPYVPSVWSPLPW